MKITFLGAVGSGTDVAIEASDITLIKGSPNGVVTAMQISRATLRNVYLWPAKFNYRILTRGGVTPLRFAEYDPDN